MRTVRRFDRCRIGMYFRDHPPPHFHIVTRSEERVAVLIETLGIMAGTADARDLELALAWAGSNRVKRYVAYGGNTRGHHENQRRQAPANPERQDCW